MSADSTSPDGGSRGPAAVTGGFLPSLHMLLAAACGAALCRGWGAAVLLALTGLLCTFRDPAALRAPLTRSFVIFAGLIALSAYWSNGGSLEHALPTAMVMLMRAVTVVWAAATVAASASIEDFAHVGSRLGLRGLGFAAGTAANSMTRTAAEMRDVWWTIRMRRGGRLALRDWRRLALTVLARTVSRADDVAMAAEARGLDPSAFDGPAPRASNADRAWSAAAWAAAAVAVALDYLSRA